MLCSESLGKVVIDFEIASFERVGPIHFGMSPAMVEAQLGPAGRRRKSPFRKNEVTEFRYGNSLQIVIADVGVVEVMMFPEIATARYGDCCLLQEPASLVFAHLCKLDGDPQEVVGVIVLLNLGISLAGFQHDDGSGQKSATAFVRGRWDDAIDKLAPFKNTTE